MTSEPPLSLRGQYHKLAVLLGSEARGPASGRLLAHLGASTVMLFGIALAVTALLTFALLFMFGLIGALWLGQQLRG